LASHFPPQRIVTLPFDRHVRAGNGIRLELLNKQSKRRYLELAAALASTFPQRNRVL
jgi:chromosome partitioning protein